MRQLFALKVIVKTLTCTHDSTPRNQATTNNQQATTNNTHYTDDLSWHCVPHTSWLFLFAQKHPVAPSIPSMKPLPRCSVLFPVGMANGKGHTDGMALLEWSSTIVN